MRCNRKKRDPNGPNKANGYKRNLYRNTRDGKIAGVCAGFADSFEIPVWVARLIFISLVIFTFQIALIGYVVAIFMLAKRQPRTADDWGHDSSNKVFNYHKPASSRLQDIRDRLRRLDEQVGSMEGYVTSKKYHTNNQINDL
ncbi:hypothetical protein A9R01_17755 ['Osedax' symbiont bacterium Rs2_46_30_T18]|nr:hypothetical protein A9R01_17755 ['Osedax' symbiont bacterium Rs2_46_30_T18]